LEISASYSLQSHVKYSPKNLLKPKELNNKLLKIKQFYKLNLKTSNYHGKLNFNLIEEGG